MRLPDLTYQRVPFKSAHAQRDDCFVVKAVFAALKAGYIGEDGAGSRCAVKWRRKGAS